MKLHRFALLSALSYAVSTRIVDKGLNLPVTQGTTRDGAFFPGLYQLDYQPKAVARAANRAGFSALRLAVNVETANNLTALQKHKAYIDAAGGRGVICMFDTSSAPGASWPRTGTVTGKIDQVANAWKSVHTVFGSYGDNVMYEIFNEPWGYKADAVTYVREMTDVVRLAGLPHNRVILAGLYGSADVQSVARAGWQGYLAYHVYVFWLPEGQRTQELFSQRIQQDLAGLSDRVFITEFGVGLDGLKANIDQDELNKNLAVTKYVDQKSVTSDWHEEHPENLKVVSICDKYPGNAWCNKFKKKLGLLAQKKKKPSESPLAAGASQVAEKVTEVVGNMLGADVAAQLGGEAAAATEPRSAAAPAAYQNDTMAFLGGMRDALYVMKRKGVGVRGLYHWHGWHNGDTWDFWDAANARSSRMIQMMMMDQAEGTAPMDMAGTTDTTDAYMSEDFVKDEQAVHMVVARHLGKKSTATCPEECGAKHCWQGSEAQIGGKHLTGGFCTHNCSKVYGENRYCGVGEGYKEESAINCGGCAHPPMCDGLPCWTEEPEQPMFLQKRALRRH